MKSSIAFLLASGAHSWPAFKDNIPNGHGVHNCDNNIIGGVGHKTQCPHGNCHTKGGGLRNTFGEDFAAAGQQWTEDLCRKDSDGDGKTNGQELGDPDCEWTPGSTPKFDTGITHPGEDCSLSMCTAEHWPTPSEWMFPSKPPSNTDERPPGCQRYEYPDTTDTWVTRFPGTQTVPHGTTYLKMAFNRPDDADDLLITKFKINLNDSRVVHHMVLYRCSEDMTKKGFSQPSPFEGLMMECPTMLMVWAVGGQDFCTPENIGFPVKAGEHFLLEVHYDNPQGHTDVMDTSGYEMTGVKLSKHPEMNIAMVWFLGPALEEIQIPPGVKEHRMTAVMDPVIPAAETETMEIFAYMQHQHLLGTKQWLLAEKPDGTIDEVICDTEYNFDLQETRYMPTYYKVEPGTKLILDCVWDSTSRSTVTTGGENTTQEMCFVFIYFIGYHGKSGIGMDFYMTQPGMHEWANETEKTCGCPYGWVRPIDGAFERRMNFILLHGGFMLLAWGFLVPLGVAFPLGWRKVIPQWVDVHEALQLGGALITVLAFILAFIVTENHFNFSVPHKTFGLAISLLALVQIIGGVKRPHKPDAGDEASPATKARSLWLLAHRLGAILLLAGSVAQCISGALLYADMGGEVSTSSFFVILAVGWGVCFASIAAGRILESRGVVFGGQWEKQVDDEVKEGQELENVS